MGLGFLILVPWMFNCFLIVSGNVEGDSLSAWKSSLSDPDSVLASWDASLVNPCTWFRITCDNDNSVTRIDLGDANLSGQLVPQLGSLPNLQYLELYNNNISGKIPPELGNLSSLMSLDLYQNILSGPIPAELGKISKLRFLRLNNNALSGAIPLSLTNVASLQVLDLSNNNISGIVPVNGSFSLFSATSFEGNPHLKIPSRFQTMTPEPVVQNSVRTGEFPGLAVCVGVVAGAVLLFAAFASTLVWWRRSKDQGHFAGAPGL